MSITLVRVTNEQTLCVAGPGISRDGSILLDKIDKSQGNSDSPPYAQIEKQKIYVPYCGAECEYVFVPTIVQAVLRDGPTGSWPSKGNRFKNYRAKKSEEMKGRQEDRYGHLNRDCIPNYEGQRTEDWREAQSLAMKDKEKRPDSLKTAKTFEPQIKKEQQKKGSPISK